MTTRTIDAHQHFWQRGRFKDGWLDEPKHKPISGSYLPEDLAPLLRQCGIDGSVFVQTQHDLGENRWVLDLAKKNPFILGEQNSMMVESTEMPPRPLAQTPST